MDKDEVIKKIGALQEAVADYERCNDSFIRYEEDFSIMRSAMNDIFDVIKSFPANMTIENGESAVKGVGENPSLDSVIASAAGQRMGQPVRDVKSKELEK